MKLTVIFAGALFAVMANATVLLDTTSQVTAADPTQQGRLSRNGLPQDWSGGEAFSGVINPGVTYHYTTITLHSPAAQFLQITADYLSGNIFASAYLGSYNPAAGLNVNWLGDAGFSGNFFGADPLFFQVVVPPLSDLVLVINETTGPAGLGLLQPFRLLVEGFIDTEFTDIPVPTPGTVSLFAIALLGFAFARGKVRVRV